MPRKARIDAPGALHHIICRGIERRKIFRTDFDRNDFLDRLEENLVESDTPCYAWALMPNHFHMLLRTGNVPIAKVMSRLLSGYAGGFNRRHRRTGHLFQNRYKSILCQDDVYLLELVRYIHLNPLRSELVQSMDELDQYRFSGHGVLMGHHKMVCQDEETVLKLFGRRTFEARIAYRSFVEKGISLGKRAELTGGGLIRSLGGWGAVKSLRRRREHLKGDERILGDSDFVESVLTGQNERLERRYALQSKGFDFEALVQRVEDIYGLKTKEVLSGGKQPERVEARSLACYWAVKELGLTTVEVSRRLGITQPAVSRAVYRGEKMAKSRGLHLMPEKKNIKT